VDDVISSVRADAPLGQIADAIAQQRHVIITECRHDQITQTTRVFIRQFQEGSVLAGFHFAAFILHQQMTGFGRAIEIEYRHAEDAL